MAVAYRAQAEFEQVNGGMCADAYFSQRSCGADTRAHIYSVVTFKK